jgi:hypothetical protein
VATHGERAKTVDGRKAPIPAVPPKLKVSGEFDEADIRNFVNATGRFTAGRRQEERPRSVLNAIIEPDR